MPDSKPIDEMSIEELEAMLNEEAVHKTKPDVPAEPTVTPAPELEPETVTPTPEPEAPPEEIPTAAAPTEEPEPDPAAIEAEARRIDEERRDTVIAKLEAHNSRLAGKIGELQKAQRQAGTQYQEIPQDDDRLVLLQRELQEVRDAQRSEARQRLVSGEIQSMLDKPYLKGVEKAHIDAATAKFEAAWNEAIAEEDPDLARLNARTVLLSVAAEARRSQLERVQTTARERIAEQTRTAASAKARASVSASGSAPSPAPVVALKDKSIVELEKMLDEITR